MATVLALAWTSGFGTAFCLFYLGKKDWWMLVYTALMSLHFLALAATVHYQHFEGRPKPIVWSLNLEITEKNDS